MRLVKTRTVVAGLALGLALASCKAPNVTVNTPSPSPTTEVNCVAQHNCDDTWTPVGQEMADSLAEGDTAGHDDRAYEDCMVQMTTTVFRVVCPWGEIITQPHPMDLIPTTEGE